MGWRPGPLAAAGKFRVPFARGDVVVPNRIRIANLIAVVTSVLLLGACVHRAVETEIPRDAWRVNREATVTRQVVLLPGFTDDERLFRSHGFPEIAARHDELTAGWVWTALDAHVGYYRTGRMPERFQQEVLAAHADVPVTLFGASFGGFGAVYLARNFPDQCDQLVLAAPYLGSRALLKRLIDKGPDQVQPKNRREAEVINNWRFLLEAERRGTPDITILIGERDRLLPAVNLLRTQAPSLKVQTAPGGHKWVVWRALFADWLAAQAQAGTGTDE